MNKSNLMDNISLLTNSINKLASEDSLATLDHKVKKRQAFIEALFHQFSAELTQDDLAKLDSIRQSTGKLLQAMESSKIDKSEQIIKNKNKSQRIRLYTNIAKQK